jgi:hypothetical protein
MSRRAYESKSLCYCHVSLHVSCGSTTTPTQPSPLPESSYLLYASSVQTNAWPACAALPAALQPPRLPPLQVVGNKGYVTAQVMPTRSTFCTCSLDPSILHVSHRLVDPPIYLGHHPPLHRRATKAMSLCALCVLEVHVIHVPLRRVNQLSIRLFHALPAARSSLSSRSATSASVTVCLM